MKKFNEFGGPLAAFIKNSPAPERSTIFVAFTCNSTLVWYETADEAKSRHPHLQFDEIELPGFRQRLQNWQDRRREFEQEQISAWKDELMYHFREFKPEAFALAYECLTRMAHGPSTYDEIADEMPLVIEAIATAIETGRAQERQTTFSEGRCA